MDHAEWNPKFSLSSFFVSFHKIPWIFRDGKNEIDLNRKMMFHSDARSAQKIYYLVENALHVLLPLPPNQSMTYYYAAVLPSR